MIGVERPRLDTTIVAVRIAPIRALPVFESPTLSLRCTPAVLVVHGFANAVADETADNSPANHTGNMTAWAAAECAPDQRPS